MRRCSLVNISIRSVTIHSAVFCIVYSSAMFVVDAIGDLIVDTYSSIGLVILYCLIHR